MTKPHLILHIGAEKTGTSSIQQFLFTNKRALARRGYYYLHTPGRNDCRTLPILCMSNPATDDFVKVLGIHSPEQRSQFLRVTEDWFQSEMLNAAGKYQFIVVSSEHLSSRLTSLSEIQKLRELIQSHVSRITIIFYVRSQAEAMPSSYSTEVRSGSKRSFSDFYEWYLKNPRKNLDAMIQQWETVFKEDDIRVRPFSRSKYIDNALLREFCDLIHVDFHNNLDLDIEEKNRSLGSRALALIRLANTIIPRFRSDGKENKMNRLLVRWIPKLTQGRKLILTEVQRRKVEQHFSESNDRLRSRYFPDERFM